jgi:N-acetyl-gamma-glutamylphosphate reductase
MNKTLKDVNKILVSVQFSNSPIGAFNEGISSDYVVLNNSNLTDDEVIKELHNRYADVKVLEIIR